MTSFPLLVIYICIYIYIYIYIYKYVNIYIYQAVQYDLFSSAVSLPYFSMLILPLPLLGLGSKSTSLSPGFCVLRPRQPDAICWELNLISGFFAFFWLTVWADGINKCGWCPAGGRAC